MTDQNLTEALELAESFHDGTDYNFDRLTPDEQEEIIAAARRWDALDSVGAAEVRSWFRGNMFDGSEGGTYTAPVAGLLDDMVEVVGFIFEEMGLIEDAYEWAALQADPS